MMDLSKIYCRAHLPLVLFLHLGSNDGKVNFYFYPTLPFITNLYIT